MKQVLLYSIENQYVKKIENGIKRIEVRKRTLPKWALRIISHGESVEAYAYETIGKSFYVSEKTWEEKYPEWYGYEIFNKKGLRLISEGRGQVVVRFKIKKSDEITYEETVKDKFGLDETDNEYMTDQLREKEILEFSCLTVEELYKYQGDGRIYAHHIEEAESIEAMDLEEFYKPNEDAENVGAFGWAFEYDPFTPIKKAPQSFMTAYIKGEENNG